MDEISFPKHMLYLGVVIRSRGTLSTYTAKERKETPCQTTSEEGVPSTRGTCCFVFQKKNERSTIDV